MVALSLSLAVEHALGHTPGHAGTHLGSHVITSRGERGERERRRLTAAILIGRDGCLFFFFLIHGTVLSYTGIF